MALDDILTLRAGPAAREALAGKRLTPDRIGALAGAAGGPKWLILSALDRYIFGAWLPRAQHPIALVGSSIGAWRFAAGCHRTDPAGAIATLERAYLGQRYSARPDRAEITNTLRAVLDQFFDRDVLSGVLQHPCYHLHAVTARSRRLTQSERQRWLTAGSGLSAVANAVSRRALGCFYERVVFARHGYAAHWAGDGLPTRTVALTADNARDAVYASGSIPVLMRGVVDPDGAPPGVYRDGGLIDYHLDHPIIAPGGSAPIVLMPHFGERVIPGWFDKALPWRRPRFADHTLMLGPGPALLKRLSHGRVPDRKDFRRYAGDDDARLAAWRRAIDVGQHMRDAFMALTESPDPLRYVKPL